MDFYRYLVEINTKTDVEEFADASVVGTVIHEALDTHYPIGILTEKYITSKIDLILLDIEKGFIKIFSEQARRKVKNYLSLAVKLLRR